MRDSAPYLNYLLSLREVVLIVRHDNYERYQ